MDIRLRLLENQTARKSRRIAGRPRPFVSSSLVERGNGVLREVEFRREFQLNAETERWYLIKRSKDPLTSWLLRSWFMDGAYPQRDKGQIAVKRSYEYQLFGYTIDTVSALWGYTPGGQPVQAPCTILKHTYCTLHLRSHFCSSHCGSRYKRHRRNCHFALPVPRSF